MFKKVAFAALVAGASLMSAPAFAASPVVGTWETSVQVQDNTMKATMTIAETAGGYSVEIKEGPMPGAPADAPPLQSTISDVKVDGAKFSFKRSLAFGDMPFELAYSGTVDGDSMTAEVTSPMGAIPLTGTRQ